MKKTAKPVPPLPVRSNVELGVVFKRLLTLPPEHEYWKNKWMFTKPVFMNESGQGTDQKRFWMWATTLPSWLMKYIAEAPNVQGEALPADTGGTKL